MEQLMCKRNRALSWENQGERPLVTGSKCPRGWTFVQKCRKSRHSLILNEVATFADRLPQRDDMTLVVMQVQAGCSV